MDWTMDYVMDYVMNCHAHVPENLSHPVIVEDSYSSIISLAPQPANTVPTVHWKLCIWALTNLD